MKSDNKIQMLIQKYFLQWLMAQRNVSPETIKSYRNTFRLYLRYIEKHFNVILAIIPRPLTAVSRRCIVSLGF